MRDKVFNVLAQVNLWCASVYCFFMSLVLFKAPSSLVVTPRHQLVFEYILSRDVFGWIYLAVGLVLLFSIYHYRARFFSLMLIAVLDLFWAAIAIFPALFGYVPQGNLISAMTSFGLCAMTVTLAVLCYYSYNKKSD